MLSVDKNNGWYALDFHGRVYPLPSLLVWLNPGAQWRPTVWPIAFPFPVDTREVSRKMTVVIKPRLWS